MSIWSWRAYFHLHLTHCRRDDGRTWRICCDEWALRAVASRICLKYVNHRTVFKMLRSMLAIWQSRYVLSTHTCRPRVACWGRGPTCWCRLSRILSREPPAAPQHEMMKLGLLLGISCNNRLILIILLHVDESMRSGGPAYHNRHAQASPSKRLRAFRSFELNKVLEGELRRCLWSSADEDPWQDLSKVDEQNKSVKGCSFHAKTHMTEWY